MKPITTLLRVCLQCLTPFEETAGQTAAGEESEVVEEIVLEALASSTGRASCTKLVGHRTFLNLLFKLID